MKRLNDADAANFEPPPLPEDYEVPNGSSLLPVTIDMSRNVYGIVVVPPGGGAGEYRELPLPQ